MREMKGFKKTPCPLATGRELSRRENRNSSNLVNAPASTY
jgi:hypothetical protein